MLLWRVPKNNTNTGFTLTEILVTTIVVGVIGAIAAPNILGLLNRNRVNRTINKIEGAIKEAQRQAIRDGKSCTIDITNATRKVSGGCLLSDREFGDYINLNSNQTTISFSSKGNTATNATIRVTATGTDLEGCLVVSGGLGLIRTGEYIDTDSNGTKDTCVSN